MKTNPASLAVRPVDLEEGYYRILVRIVDQRLDRHGMRLIATPGMTATVGNQDRRKDRSGIFTQTLAVDDAKPCENADLQQE